jgi:hypothetical protein
LRPKALAPHVDLQVAVVPAQLPGHAARVEENIDQILPAVGVVSRVISAAEDVGRFGLTSLPHGLDRIEVSK